MMKSIVKRCATFLFLLFSALAVAQPVYPGAFSPQEYAARRAKVFARIGDGVAILEGAAERPGEQPFRQGNQLAYLCNLLQPRVLLVLDGKTHRATAYLPPVELVSKSGVENLSAVLPEDPDAV